MFLSSLTICNTSFFHTIVPNYLHPSPEPYFRPCKVFTIYYENKTGAHEDYCIPKVVNLLRVSVTFCGRFQRGVLRRIYTKTSNTVYKYKILSSKYVIQNMLKHKIQTQAIIYNFILFINILITCYIQTFPVFQDGDKTHTHTRHMNTSYSRNLPKIISSVF